MEPALVAASRIVVAIRRCHCAVLRHTGSVRLPGDRWEVASSCMLAHHAVAVGIDGGDQLLDLISGELYAYVPHHRSDLLGINVPVAVHICEPHSPSARTRAQKKRVDSCGPWQPQPQLHSRSSAAAALQPQLCSRSSAAAAPQPQPRSQPRSQPCSEPPCSHAAAAAMLQPPRCSSHHAAAARARMLRGANPSPRSHSVRRLHQCDAAPISRRTQLKRSGTHRI